jgi:hypothetical protein
MTRLTEVEEIAAKTATDLLNVSEALGLYIGSLQAALKIADLSQKIGPEILKAGSILENSPATEELAANLALTPPEALELEKDELNDDLEETDLAPSEPETQDLDASASASATTDSDDKPNESPGASLGLDFIQVPTQIFEALTATLPRFGESSSLIVSLSGFHDQIEPRLSRVYDFLATLNELLSNILGLKPHEPEHNHEEPVKKAKKKAKALKAKAEDFSQPQKRDQAEEEPDLDSLTLTEVDELIGKLFK